MKICSILISMVLTLSLFMPAAAQSPPAHKSKEEIDKTQEAPADKALALLDETLVMSQSLKLAENRAFVQLQAADLLWPYDEKKARALLREAMAFIGAALSGVEGRSPQREMSLGRLSELRSQALQKLAGRDAQLAIELLRSSRPAPGEASGDQGNPRAGERELQLEQIISEQAARSNPQFALKLAEENLSKGVNLG